MKVKSVEEIIAFLQPIATAQGVELIDAEWKLHEPSLTLYIDCPQGVDLNICEAFHRAVDLPLDELDPSFGAPYTLNCSSPGLDRPFKTARDFERHMGEKVEVKLYAPQKGKKLFEGTLLAYDGTCVTVQTADGEEKFPMNKVAKICCAIEFD